MNALVKLLSGVADEYANCGDEVACIKTIQMIYAACDLNETDIPQVRIDCEPFNQMTLAAPATPDGEMLHIPMSIMADQIDSASCA